MAEELDTPTEADAAPEPSEPPDWPSAWPILLFVAFAITVLLVYHASLRGAFISDDIGYFHSNPYTRALTAENVRAIFDPTGPAKLHTANYAPVHLFLHALEWRMFAENTLGYHVINCLVHALNATLMVLLLGAWGIPRVAAIAGGTLFLLHPANVEAVAWMSQLKTSGCLAFALGALLAWRRHPAAATVLFALGLLTKTSAFFVLPVAATLLVIGRDGEFGDRRHRLWLSAQVAIFALYAIPQYQSFAHLGGVEVAAFGDPWVQVRTVAGIGARYLVMAVSSYGVSAFQEPLPSTSWFDPWFLLALPLGALLAWRTAVCLRRRSFEAAFWVAAAASFFPVSQVFPFATPVADRYLYTILPGLIGGALYVAGELGIFAVGTSGSSGTGDRKNEKFARFALAAAVALAVFFGIRSEERAKLWRLEALLLVDAAAHYPDGITAHLLYARRAAQAGDDRLASQEIRLAADRGFDNFMGVYADAGLAPLHGSPHFHKVLQEMAGRFLDRARERGYGTQPELWRMADAHLIRNEIDEAEAQVLRALEVGGPLDAGLREKLTQIRASRAGS